MPSSNVVHVAVAVIENTDGQFFIAKRSQLSHQGGLWEFPGGKVESGEIVLDALKRELFEEIGISITKASPLIRIPHVYSDKSVLLDVWKVESFTGNAFGKEGQETQWINKEELSLFEFPQANIPIIKALQLPDKYMITGDFRDEGELLKYIQAALARDVKLIQFRAHNLDEKDYFAYAKKIYTLCENVNAKLLLNTSVTKYKKYNANEFSHGLHLRSKEISSFSSSDFDTKILIAASTHNQDELLLAQDKKIDFCILSPVNKTLSHPDTTPLGWDKFQQLTEMATMPVYALGGMLSADLIYAQEKGAQGISAIGEFWWI